VGSEGRRRRQRLLLTRPGARRGWLKCGQTKEEVKQDRCPIELACYFLEVRNMKDSFSIMLYFVGNSTNCGLA
jgi:hypothetical protein